jgi:hypothetical protein
VIDARLRYFTAQRRQLAIEARGGRSGGGNGPGGREEPTPQ